MEYTECAKLISLYDNSEIKIESPECSVGRAMSNTYMLKDMRISRCHFVIRATEDERFILTDKSSNGTMVNGTLLKQDETCSLQNEDIIQVTDNIKYRMWIPTLSLPTKRRRVDDKQETVAVESNSTSQIAEPSKSFWMTNLLLDRMGIEPQRKAPDTVENLKETINMLQNQTTKLIREQSSTSHKVLELEVDLFNKATANLALEQENAELKVNCDTFKKEKEELNSQMLSLECEVALLKKELQNINAERNAIDESKVEGAAAESANANDKDKDLGSLLGAEPIAEDEAAEKAKVEDKKLLGCLLRAEVFEKEISINEKLSQYLSSLKREKRKLSPLSVKKHVEELRDDLEELINKRNELDEVQRDEKMPKDGSTFKHAVEQIVEAELQCSICNELFVKPAALNCKHMFCNACILRWKKEKNTCPVCRVTIESVVECKPVDTYLDQLLSLSPSKQKIRMQLKQTHQDCLNELEKQTKPCSSRSSSISRRTRNQTIYVSSSSDSDSDDSFDAVYMEIPYYGGYGRCYVCGGRGHWANGCPIRS